MLRARCIYPEILIESGDIAALIDRIKDGVERGSQSLLVDGRIALRIAGGLQQLQDGVRRVIRQPKDRAVRTDIEGLVAGATRRLVESKFDWARAAAKAGAGEVTGQSRRHYLRI